MIGMRRIVAEGYDAGRYAEVFRSRSKFMAFERPFFDALLELLPRRPRVLDWGCGTGVPYDKHLVEHGCVVTGVDISRKHLAKARANVPEAAYIEGDFSALRFEQRWDGLVSLYSIFHLPRGEHEALLARISELLTDQGVLLLTVGAREVEDVQADWLGTPMAWSSLAPERYVEMPDALGFRLVQSCFEGRPEDEEYHLGILGVKKQRGSAKVPGDVISGGA